MKVIGGKLVYEYNSSSCSSKGLPTIVIAIATFIIVVAYQQHT